jgi:hypothetical protein
MGLHGFGFALQHGKWSDSAPQAGSCRGSDGRRRGPVAAAGGAEGQRRMVARVLLASGVCSIAGAGVRRGVGDNVTARIARKVTAESHRGASRRLESPGSAVGLAGHFVAASGRVLHLVRRAAAARIRARVAARRTAAGWSSCIIGCPIRICGIRVRTGPCARRPAARGGRECAARQYHLPQPLLPAHVQRRKHPSCRRVLRELRTFVCADACQPDRRVVVDRAV